MRTKTSKRMAFIGAGVAALMTIAGPASANAGSGFDITLDSASPGRFVSGGANYAISHSPTPGHVLVEFECDATSGFDSTQTRVLPWWQNGCVLYKGSTAVAIADGQSLPGPAAVTQKAVDVDLNIAGPFSVCWSVSATFATNNGDDLYNSGCTGVNAPDIISTLDVRDLSDLVPDMDDFIIVREPDRP